MVKPCHNSITYWKTNPTIKGDSAPQTWQVMVTQKPKSDILKVVCEAVIANGGAAALASLTRGQILFQKQSNVLWWYIYRHSNVPLDFDPHVGRSKWPHNSKSRFISNGLVVVDELGADPNLGSPMKIFLGPDDDAGDIRLWP
jgi:hypothetical protein